MSENEKQHSGAVILDFSYAVEKKELADQVVLQSVSNVREQLMGIANSWQNLEEDAKEKIAQGKIEEALKSLDELAFMGNHYGKMMGGILRASEGFKNYLAEFKKIYLIYEDAKGIPDYLALRNSTFAVMKDFLEYGNGKMFYVSEDTKPYCNSEEGMAAISDQIDQLYLKTDILARLHQTIKSDR